MHRNLCDVTSRISGRGGLGLDVLAAVLLSLCVGAATAAFTVMNRIATHRLPNITCEMMLEMPSGPSAYGAYTAAALPSPIDVHERVVNAFQTGYEAGGVAMGSGWEVASVPDLRALAPLFAAGALAMLLACTRVVARLGAVARAPAVIAGSAIGALMIAAVLVELFGLPALGIRAIAFAVSVSLLAARFPRSAWQEMISAPV